VEPVEINAGAWYLRALRADDRIDDRPALAELHETDEAYVARRAADWASDAAYSWAVCEPSTGELLAEVLLEPGCAALRVWAREGHDAAAAAAADSIRRFAMAALGIDAT
jgi:hypothetical protein